MDIKKYYNGKIITGIEFDFVYDKKDFHMLGYNFDVENLKNSKFIDKRTEEDLIKEEEKNLEFFKEVCQTMGMKLSSDLKITKYLEKTERIAFGSDM